ncbi:hypothetical protein Pmani_000734 [Petrolisthes manimaculis]|uniref:Uncharacterized protein n=1 Tax=Petrolisthes manimaculis TaxID=1843537 RepID=A0AAE1QL29_9EUCA|nr:hypothetical protein Pmani_000734 [Petrolisthes manimaculis]
MLYSCDAYCLGTHASSGGINLVLQVLAGLGVENNTRRLEEQLRVGEESSIRVENPSGRTTRVTREGKELKTAGSGEKTDQQRPIRRAETKSLSRGKLSHCSSVNS